MNPVPHGAEDDRAIQACAILDKKVLPQDGLLSEDLTMQLFALYDLPEPLFTIAAKEDDLPRLLEQVGLPVVLKISSPTILEREQKDMLRLGVSSLEEAKKAYADILEKAKEHAPTAGVRGVLVQHEVPHDNEFFLHAVRRGEEIHIEGDIEKLPEIRKNIQALMEDVPDITEIRIDPAVQQKEAILIVDAKIILKRPTYIDAD